MRIPRTYIYAIFTATMLLCLLLIPIQKAQAAAPNCVVPTDYATIQGAVNDLACTSIHVNAGTYHEALVVDHSVDIQGAGAQTTSIAPTTAPGTIVQIIGGTTHVDLSGFTIRYQSGTYPSNMSSQVIGVHVTGNADANIHDNVITEIHDTPSSGNQTGRCILVGSGSSMATGNNLGPGTATIDHNAVSFCQKNSIQVYGAASHAVITNNTVAGGNMGEGKVGMIYATNGIDIVYGWADIRNNTISDFHCNDVPCGSDPISDLQSTGILLYAVSAPTNVEGNHLASNVDVGIDDYNSGVIVNTYTGNFLDNALHANMISTGSTNNLVNNQMTGSAYGLLVHLYSGLAFPGAVHLLGGNHFNGAQYGVRAVQEAGVSDGPLIDGSRNDFSGNVHGEDVRIFETASLPCNWWGDVSGPTTMTNAHGAGEHTSNDTMYMPFSVSATTFECGNALLSVSLSFDQTTVPADTAAKLTYTLSNNSTDVNSGMAQTLSMPDGMTLQKISSSTCTGTANFQNNVLQTNAMSLAAHTSCAITLLVSAHENGHYQVLAPISSLTSLRGSLLDAATASLDVKPSPTAPALQADLALTVQDVPTHMQYGQLTPMNFVLTNNGPGASDPAAVFVHMSDKIRVYKDINQECRRMNNAHVLACDFGSLAPGQKIVIHLRVKPAAIGTVYGSGKVVMRGHEDDLTNNETEFVSHVGGIKITMNKKATTLHVHLSTRRVADTTVIVDGHRAMTTKKRDFNIALTKKYWAHHPHPVIVVIVRTRGVHDLIARYHMGKTSTDYLQSIDNMLRILS